MLDQEAESRPTEESKDKKKKDKNAKAEKEMQVVKQDVRLNNRIIDLRVPTN